MIRLECKRLNERKEQLKGRCGDRYQSGRPGKAARRSTTESGRFYCGEKYFLVCHSGEGRNPEEQKIFGLDSV